MEIRKTCSFEKKDILNIHEKAFGKKKGPEIAELVNCLLEDDTAMPYLSMVAKDGDKFAGHILFTRAEILNADEDVSVQILAPLAIDPDYQGRGVGALLINKGIKALKESGVDLVFVLGHPEYYPRCGFKTAGILGFEAPYHIPDEHADAWMVQELKKGFIGRVSGKIKCSDVLDEPQHWRE